MKIYYCFIHNSSSILFLQAGLSQDELFYWLGSKLSCVCCETFKWDLVIVENLSP